VKILDFGIAKVVQDAQKMAGSFAKTSGQITSFTPAYGAPEQFSRANGATGPWTDVFALALVCTEVLSGRDPLEGDDFVQLAFSTSNPASRPTPRARGAGVTDAVEGVFARALAVKPEERYATVGEFWSSLRAASDLPAKRKITADVPSSSNPYAATVVADASGANPAVPAVAASPLVQTAALPPSPPQRPTKSTPVIAGVAAIFLAGGAVAAFFYARGHAPATPAMSALPSASAPPIPSAPASGGAASGACPAGMLPIPGGEYFMGSDDDLDLEKPAHHVTLAPYCIGATEVTVADYKACSDRGACKRAGLANEWKGITDHEKRVFDPLCNGRDAKRANHPVNCVDWEQAREYCEALAPGARLPTEAEWEFAARGPDGRKYPWGDELPSASLLNACGPECVAWGKANDIAESAMYEADDGFPNTAPVGSFPQGRSRYGVADVAGNVWEWVADWFAPYPKDAAAKSPVPNPKGPGTGTERVVRGGSWNGTNPAWVRPTFRYHEDPATRAYGTGFRCAKSQ
jgi:formylglycine-generating enzyme required for sulfatase activity